jgi:NhaP-type Na+/H+ or K+/H+ antiporter
MIQVLQFDDILSSDMSFLHYELNSIKPHYVHIRFFLLALVGTSWGFLLLLYVFVQISRLIVVSALYPLLRHFGYGLDMKEAMILVWSGLRGAVALSLSLSVKVSLFHLCTNKPCHLCFIFKYKSATEFSNASIGILLIAYQ